MTPSQTVQRKAIAAICPHAGLMYSGAVAGLVYASIPPPATFVLMGPNHTGMGKGVALMREGQWSIPTGTLTIDTPLADSIASLAPMVSTDEVAHMYEHSLEVQLPFILKTAPDAGIVPITIMRASFEQLMELGSAVAKAITQATHPAMLIASSDMSHFVSDTEARELDKLAIDRVLALDPEGLYHVVREKDITMCGILPTVAMLSAALDLGATSAELLRYTTSAEVSGDYDRVVGYAGIVIT